MQHLEYTVTLSSIGAWTGKAEANLTSAIVMHIYGERVQGLKNKMYVMEAVNMHILVVYCLYWYIVYFGHELWKLSWTRKNTISPGQSGLVGWASPCAPKGCWFDSRSGNMPGLCVRSQIRASTEGSWSIFLSLSPFHSLKSREYIYFKNHPTISRFLVRMQTKNSWVSLILAHRPNHQHLGLEFSLIIL